MGNSAVVSSVELLLMDGDDKLMKFPDDAKILIDKNLWIGYTSSKCDTNFIKAGTKDTETPKGSSGVVA